MHRAEMAAPYRVHSLGHRFPIVAICWAAMPPASSPWAGQTRQACNANAYLLLVLGNCCASKLVALVHMLL